MLFLQYFSVLWIGIGLLCAPPLVADSHAVSPLTLSHPNQQQQQHQQAAGKVLFDSSDDTAKPWNPDLPLTFSLPNGEEQYQLVIDGHPRHSERPSCSEDELRNVTINGQPLSLSSLDSADLDTLVLIGSVGVTDEVSGRKRSINLVVQAKCFHISKDQPGSEHAVVDGSPWNPSTPVLGFHSLLVVDVDGQPWTGESFSVPHQLLNGHVPEVTIIASDSPSLQDHLLTPRPPTTPHTPQAQEEPEETELPEQSSFPVAVLASHIKAGYSHKDSKWCGIKEPACLLRKLSTKSREYLDLVLGKLNLDDHSGYRMRCHGMDGPARSDRAKVFDGREKNSCRVGYRPPAARPSEEDYDLLLSDDGDSVAEATFYPDSHISLSSSSSFAGTHHIHAAIGVVASLLCLTCITTCLHRRCCNPRARAERAALREERRVRRQYRCAARRQAWKDWWADRRAQVGFGGRRRARRTGDYEEKRALILQQEAVLENAMQNEIYKLQRQARHVRAGPIDDVLSMVEEGRGSRISLASSSSSQRSASRPPSIAETLPPYRSRAGSGRPPSYNEIDQHAGNVVTDGFEAYAPSSHATIEGLDQALDDETRSLRSLGSFSTGRTSPASSVVNLSPRHSSETLRTERSSV